MRIWMIISLTLLTALLFLFPGCAVYYGGDRYAVSQGEILDEPGVLFLGRGEGSSRREAQRDAERALLTRAVVQLLDEAGDEQELCRLIYALQQPADYIVPGTPRVVEWDEEDGLYWVVIEARVHMNALHALLGQ